MSGHQILKVLVSNKFLQGTKLLTAGKGPVKKPTAVHVNHTVVPAMNVFHHSSFFQDPGLTILNETESH